jgi:biopolymer transport protein ExbB/TolQ
MGFLRNVGYFFAVIILILGMISFLYGVPWIGLGIIIFAIIIIAILRHFGKNAQMRHDIHYMADRERRFDEELEDAERKLAGDQKKLDELEREKQKKQAKIQANFDEDEDEEKRYNENEKQREKQDN